MGGGGGLQKKKILVFLRGVPSAHYVYIPFLCLYTYVSFFLKSFKHFFLKITHRKMPQFSLTFGLSNTQLDALFDCIAYDYLRDVPWKDISELNASTAASEFREWVQVGIDVYIPHRKYQVKPHSAFSSLCCCHS